MGRPGPQGSRNNGRPGGSNAAAARHGARPGASTPRPGNNPFSRKQGMKAPMPSDIPRPHPMARPTVNDSHRGRGGFRNGRGGRSGQGARPGQWGHSRPGQQTHQAAAAVSAALRRHPQAASAAVQAVVVAVAAALLEHSVAREASPPRPVRIGWPRGMNSRR